MVGQIGALGYFGDARRAAVGTDLIERVMASGSQVIRKLGRRAAGGYLGKTLPALGATPQNTLAVQQRYICHPSGH